MNTSSSSNQPVTRRKLNTCALINSASYQFTVSLSKETNMFTICGNHWYHDNKESIIEDVATAEEVFAFIRKYISTWCHYSIIQYFDNDFDDSRIDFHQAFKHVDQAGHCGTMLTLCFDYLRNKIYDF